VDFEWDGPKAVGNAKKHGVPFEEAVTVFGDVLGATVSDPDHSGDETRLITIGMSSKNRLLLVAHTDRGDVVRIISARQLTRKERHIYEAVRQAHH
jgi:uncharacterized protein